MKGIPKQTLQNELYVKLPTYEELAEILRHKRNNSAPGTNAVPYLVYKKCTHIFPTFKRIWKKRPIPLLWRSREAHLIPKGEDQTKLTNVSGEMFFKELANRQPDFVHGLEWFLRPINTDGIPTRRELIILIYHNNNELFARIKTEQ